MMVAGVVRNLTAESAERAALGAGAIVMDVIASNDKRLPHEKIERIRHPASRYGSSFRRY